MLTPQQQADYEYAMSQIKPKTVIKFAPGAITHFWEIGAIPELTITIKNPEEKGSIKDAEDSKST